MACLNKINHDIETNIDRTSKYCAANRQFELRPPYFCFLSIITWGSLATSPSSCARAMFVHHAGSAVRPEPDKVLKDIADYVHNYQVISDLGFETTRLSIDAIECGLEGFNLGPEYTKRLDTVVEGTIVPNGAMSFVV
ncbi:hypothetical protein K503DRAFT_867580 [Rhizopogon vinicolor AM-OR11-026]|uniref:Uncharacterized protein n=1 Tax=Rhizopogon vinicolor AM-OR11-026 TaxID=1314800 RepID=A0A1B7MUZ7_9AGAM|nr:hypothetical protein K503DRAFT_867580 [Rhizopogon vinicolor AM-OR11-026]